MAGNAWVIVALNDENDSTVDYVMDVYEQFRPVATDIPNPDWIDDGNQTSPDANGQTRYITGVPNMFWNDDGQQSDPDPQGNPRFWTPSVDQYNSAAVFRDGEQSTQFVRTVKARIQNVNSNFNVEMRRVNVEITPV